jgi:2-polyprenyl-3-methyl-5-hydroxy-6-metoxy-1,4-benzoquinol methylase
MINTKVKIFNVFRSVFKINFIGEALARSIRSDNFLSNFLSKLAPNNYQYPKNTYRKTKINGISLNLDISDYIGHYIYFGFKDAGFKELIKLSKNKQTIFDIGANIGFTALNMANSTSGNKVYAFEPDPFNYQRLEGNFSFPKSNRLR